MRIFGFITVFFLILTLQYSIVPRIFAQGTTPEVQNTACDAITDPTSKSGCNDCMVGKGGVWTAIGCIEDINNANPNSLMTKLLGLATGVSGGIAFLLILFGGLQIMTSAGNPEQLNAGRELVSSAITGLLLIIFSIFILQFIGVNIIGIPGFR